MTFREFLDTHPGAPWAALVALIALYCLGAVFVGEPALDAPADLPPARYVVAPAVVEVTASTGTPAGDVGPVASTPFVDESAATHGRRAAGSSTSPTSEGER